MFTKVTLGLAVIVVTASNALAAPKTPSGIVPSQNVYNPAGANVTDHRILDCIHVAFPQCSD
jgi:hypothetical protein